MQELFSNLAHALEASPPLALAAAALWGVLSVVLSPCHLASIPLIVAFISQQGRMSAPRAFWISALFAAGILITLALLGVITAAAGRILGDVGHYGNYILALIFLVIGLHLLGVMPLAVPGPAQPGFKQKGPVAAFLLGLIFGIALGPCTFAYMAPMLGVTFKLAAAQFLFAALLLAAYGLGHCSVIIAAGTSTRLVQHVLDWNEQSKALTILKIACGVLIIMGGLWLIYTAQ